MSANAFFKDAAWSSDESQLVTAGAHFLLGSKPILRSAVCFFVAILRRSGRNKIRTGVCQKGSICGAQALETSLY